MNGSQVGRFGQKWGYTG